jgi:hypothetical protein
VRRPNTPHVAVTPRCHCGALLQPIGLGEGHYRFGAVLCESCEAPWVLAYYGRIVLAQVMIADTWAETLRRLAYNAAAALGRNLSINPRMQILATHAYREVFAFLRSRPEILQLPREAAFTVIREQGPIDALNSVEAADAALKRPTRITDHVLEAALAFLQEADALREEAEQTKRDERDAEDS